MSSSDNPALDFVRQLGQDLASNDFDLPPFPDTALRIQEALNDPDVSIDKLSTIVLSEPALAARLLRMSNSAMIRRGPMEVTDIKTAISRIGLDMVQNAAMSFAAREAFQAPKGSPSLAQLQKARDHSIRVSALAYLLGRKVKYVGKPDEAMLAGLMHAVGKFYILIKAGDFPELFADEDTLRDLLDQWHTGVGRAIVESWGFPEQIAQAVDEHEILEREPFLSADITDLVLVANLVADADADAEADEDEIAKLADLPSLSRMNIDTDELRSLLEESREEVSSMVQALSS